MDQPASSCMRSSHPSSPIWGCMRNPHSGVPGANLQSPYQQAPFSLHQKPEFLAYTDFTSSCLLPTAPHAAYPRDERLYQENQGGYQRADWQFNPCETRVRAPEACPPVVAPVVVGGGGVGGPELDSVGGDRLPGTVPGCLEGEYSPQSVASADSDKKSSNKRKRDVTGELGCTGTDGSPLGCVGSWGKKSIPKTLHSMLRKGKHTAIKSTFGCIKNDSGHSSFRTVHRCL